MSSSNSCILGKSITWPSFAAITFEKTFLASSTYFCVGSSGQKCVKINPLTLAALAIIAAYFAVKCELISGNPCSSNKLDSQINKSAFWAKFDNLFLEENEVSEVYTIVLLPSVTFIA